MESYLRSINDFANSCASDVLNIFNSQETIFSAGKTSRQFAVALAVTTVALTLLSVSAGAFGILQAMVAGFLGVVAYDFHIFSKNTESLTMIGASLLSSVLSEQNQVAINNGQLFLKDTIVLLPIFNAVFAK